MEPSPHNPKNQTDPVKPIRRLRSPQRLRISPPAARHEKAEATSFLPIPNLLAVHTLDVSSASAMGLKLRRLAASILSPGPASPTSAADAHHAVARATARHPSTAPPSAHHLDALLAFGRGSRLSAAALATALVDRLRAAASGDGDAAVALKCLIALRVLLARGAFILRDQLLAALVRHPASGRNPLALAAFPLGRSSFAAASWVRFSARLLELILLLPDAPANHAAEYLTALPNPHLVAEVAAFAAVVDAVRHAPPPPSSSPQPNALVWEAIRLAEEDRVAAERNIAARVQEMGERLDTLSLADAVELVCVLRRVEESAAAASPPEWKWAALDEGVVCAAWRLRERAEEVVMRRTVEERRVVRRDDGPSASARVLQPVRAGGGDAVRFRSTRWAGTVSAWR
ncbi:putative clathrin assembly protein At4g40080 [Phragmites australis]|uniref:putative clathrin assembly protein At4g40080 n=1 Tax=Phragmites australis TaxID=29695 RepID=UPI002D77C46F|nr:putative clathrin assembly protein At4g40080 [Phragmites australis]XP_062199953.1 putative clathrin assembly protein At4g40080 [Phragmites australis]XP_062199954.1 putative clathrin assembly protein At4g40080 [Phragmites australis]XP_062199955.1 putative clathrin assembly protein At4g40080 [Phragmites australis]